MSSSLLDILCHASAQSAPHLYQADEGGKIRIVWEQSGARCDDERRDAGPPRGSHSGTRAPAEDEDGE
jgi:hypothetical protein